MLYVNLIEANNYDQRREKLDNILKVIQRVLNDETFEKMILDFETDHVKTFHYRKNIFGRPIEKAYTNKEVFEMIMKGAESTGDTGTGAMDLYLTLLNGSDGSTIGYGHPGTKEIFTYAVMFDSMTVPELANHYMHEWCHKIGFEHSFARNRMRNYSVPYAVGNIVEELAEKYIELKTGLQSNAIADNSLSGTAMISVDFFEGNKADHLNATLKKQNGMANYGSVNYNGGTIILKNAVAGDKIILDGLTIGKATVKITGVNLMPIPRTNYSAEHIVGFFTIQN